MECRVEPRFTIYAHGRVTPLENPEREFDCVLLDISASGFKAVGDDSLSADEIIALEIDQHVVLANVRYCVPRGDKYTIGAERIHALDKVSLPREQAKIDQIHALVEDFHRRIQIGIEGDRPVETRPASSEEKTQLDRQLAAFFEQHDSGGGESAPIDDRVVETVMARVIEYLEKAPNGVERARPLRSEIIDRLMERLATRPELWQPAAQTPAQSPATNEPPASVLVKPTPVQQASHSPSRRILLEACAAVCVVGMVMAFFGLWTRSGGGAGMQRPGASPQALAPAVRPPIQAVKVNSSGKKHAEIRVIEPTWVSAVVDGKEVLGKLLKKADVREIEFSNKALVRVGNAAGVQISLDGKPIGPLGSRGRIRLVELSAKGHRFLPLD